MKHWRYDHQAVKRLRADRGLGVEELARSARLSANSIYLYERGHSEPKASTLARLARALGVSIEAFFEAQ
jgi:transcriptional regulator with XRE-family HTH domain